MPSWTCSFANLPAERFSVPCRKPSHFWNISSGFETDPPGLSCAELLLQSMKPMHREQIRHHQFYRDAVECNISRSHRERSTVGATRKIWKDCPTPCLCHTKRDVVALMFMWEYSMPLFIKALLKRSQIFLSPKQPNNTVQYEELR